METHHGDPREEPDPWERFQAELGDLGTRLRDTYRRVSTDGGGPGEEEIRQALRTLAGVWDQVAGSVSVALKDPEVRHRMTEAAAAFASALGRTITELGSEIRDEMRQRSGDGPLEEE